ncbi:MAG TPA: SDR family oxidoreductase [bacterium]
MILVTGATGLNGSELVNRLSQRGVPLRALTRGLLKAQHLTHLPGVEVVQGDMAKPETLGEALKGVDRAMLISSSVPTMLEDQSTFIEAARKAGVKHVVKLSGIIPDPDSPFRFARMHFEIEKRLEASGMAFTQLRCGEFMPSYFRQVRLIVAQSRILLPMEDAKIASIDVGDIAEAAADCLTKSGHEGKIYPLTGPEALSMAEIAEKLSVVTGKTITYFNVTPEKAREGRLAMGMPVFLADALDELFAERRKGKESQVSTVLKDVFGLTPTTFDVFAKRNAAIFRGEQPPPKV